MKITELPEPVTVVITFLLCNTIISLVAFTLTVSTLECFTNSDFSMNINPRAIKQRILVQKGSLMVSLGSSRQNVYY